MTQHSFEEVLAPNHYFDRNFDIDAAKILPGEYYVTGRDMLLVTVLGSCVAACIRDPKTGLGGMNHFMLPESGDRNDVLSSSMRYGGYAMEVLVNQLVKMGANRARLEAKVFGGGRVMAALSSSNVGERNCSFVLDFLRTEGIAVSAQDLLDVHPRKVYFFPNTGRVLVKKLTRMHNDTLIRREKEYAARLTEAPVSGDVELF